MCCLLRRNSRNLCFASLALLHFLPPSFAKLLDVRCCCPGVDQECVRRCGSNENARRIFWQWRQDFLRFRLCSKPTVNASATFLICLQWQKFSRAYSAVPFA